MTQLYFQVPGSFSQVCSGVILTSLHTGAIVTYKLHGLSPQANYTDRLSDRRFSAKLVPTLADRGCRVVSATIPPHSLISVF
jgi:hypothetical protein